MLLKKDAAQHPEARFLGARREEVAHVKLPVHHRVELDARHVPVDLHFVLPEYRVLPLLALLARSAHMQSGLGFRVQGSGFGVIPFLQLQSGLGFSANF